MKSSLSISRNLDASHPYGFSRLRKEGIEISQDLSGQEWTDYNFHDPGVTILEQVCFALTDLIYRTRFDVADYLCDEKGVINTSSMGLHSPQDVFFGHPSTALDYQKALLDMSPYLSDVQVFGGAGGAHSGGYGIYKIRVRKSSSAQAEAIDTEELVRQTTANFHSIRNLCEDLEGEVEVVEEIDCFLEAEISVKPGFRVASVLAEVFYQASRALTRAVTYQSYSEKFRNGAALDEVFQGPFIQHGLIEDQQIAHSGGYSSKRLLESAILSASREIEGVEYIDSLKLVPANNDVDLDNLDDVCMYRLVEPDSSDSVKSVIVRFNGRPGSYTFDEFKAQYQTLMFASSSKSYSIEEDSLLSEPPRGTYRNLKSYQSVQNQFPAAYGINQFGMPENYSLERKAQALQLKSYLLLFEQVMANYLANLGSIKQLFSTRIKDSVSYYSGVLSSDEISSLERVYPENAETLLDGILGKVDDFINRKSRLLDYLLALYGEEFSQEHLRNFNFYGTDEELERSILLNKVKLLNRIKYASGDRGAAANILASPSEIIEKQGQSNSAARPGNMSGLQYRVSIFLGFKHLSSRSLVAAVFKNGFVVLADDNNESQTSTTDHDDSFITVARELYSDKGELDDKEQSFNRIVQDNTDGIDGLEDGSLSESILRSGVFEDGYSYSQKNGELSLNIRDAETETTEHSITLLSGLDSKEALKRQRFLRSLFTHISNECEGMHVLEHILLRPTDYQNKPHDYKDRYANRVSIIFPAWTARCNNPQFRLLAEDLLRDNCPAHIQADIYWLDFATMCEFEVLQHRWQEQRLAQHSAENSTNLDQAGRSLVHFLELQKFETRMKGKHQSLIEEIEQDIDSRLSRYLKKLSRRKDELEMCKRRVSDDEERDLQVIRKLQLELKGFKVCLLEHSRLLSRQTQLQEDEQWDFYVARVSAVLPKLFSFESENEGNIYFYEVKKLVEESIASFMDSGLSLDFHWLVPSDMSKFRSLYQAWESSKGHDERSAAAIELKKALAQLVAASDITGDIHEWRYILSKR